MARRDLTPVSGFDFATSGGAAASTPPEDGLDAVLNGGLARLRQVALRITRNTAVADDVVQNAVEKALRNRHRFRGEAKASTWLHRIVVNEALMWYRGETRRGAKLARVAEAIAFAAPETCTQPLDALLAVERSRLLWQALRALRPEDADLLSRCALEEHGYESWAGRARIRATAAKTRAFRARRTLRAALVELDD